MYRVNKYVPNCVDGSGVKFEYATSAEAVLETKAYKEAVGDRYLYWYANIPFDSQAYLRDLTCDMLFFVQDDDGHYWGALHVVSDNLFEMELFLKVASVRAVTENTAPKESDNDINECLRRAKLAYLVANPSVTDVDAVIDHIEYSKHGVQIYAQIVPKVKTSNFIVKVTIDNDKVDSEIG